MFDIIIILSKKILKYLSSLAVDQISNQRQKFWLKLDSTQRDSQV